jgi:site-specific DNA recombinase
MKSCLGYVRVSTQKQGEGVSLDAQRDAILSFAARSNITITQWFEEKETAAKSGRPIFNAMLKLLRNRKADGVVLHRPDRAARNFADWAKMGELADAGIDVHFASESLDFRSRGGRLSADLQAVIAADYIRNLKEEIHKGQHGQLKRGMYPFGAPIGYQNNGGNKVKTIDPVKGPMVKRVFELYSSGEHSLRTLLVEMKRIGLRSNADTWVSKGSLEAMLGNPFYAGIIKIKRTGASYSGAHEPLISPSTFERVQEVRAGKSGKKVTKHNHTYHGLFVCALCRTTMVPEMQKGHVYYRCHTSSCDTKTVREESLETTILDVLSRVRMTDEDVATILNSIEAWLEERVAHDQPQTHAMQIQSVTLRLERLTDALIDRLIDTETFNNRKTSLLLEKATLEEKFAQEGAGRPEPCRVQKFLELVKSLYATYIMATPIEKREIVKMATSNRTVSGKNVFVEPSNWLLETQKALGVLLCADDAPDSRSSHSMRDEQVEQLLGCVSKHFKAEQEE